MSLKVLPIVIGLGALLAGCASAGWHTYPSETQLAQNGVQEICHSSTPTGTNLPVRECHTQTEWDQMRENGNDQLNLDAARSMPTTDGGSANGR
jgi:hypothetical protein